MPTPPPPPPAPTLSANPFEFNVPVALVPVKPVPARPVAFTLIVAPVAFVLCDKLMLLPAVRMTWLLTVLLEATPAEKAAGAEKLIVLLVWLRVMLLPPANTSVPVDTSAPTPAVLPLMVALILPPFRGG